MWSRIVRKALVVNFVAGDRPGIVERLAAVIGDSDGNWEEARLAQLGGKFTGLALVNLPATAETAFRAALAALAAEGIDCRVTEAGADPTPAGRRITLGVLGPDRPGIVHEISRALKAADINLLRLESSVRSAPMSAEPLFHATVEATAPAALQRGALDRELEAIAERMNLELDLVQDED
jgi:glycine cleavage system regulatory protein